MHRLMTLLYRTTVFFRIHGMSMGGAIIAPSVGSLLMKYSAFLAWFAGEVCMLMSMSFVLLLPKALGKQIPTSTPTSEFGGE